MLKVQGYILDTSQAGDVSVDMPGGADVLSADFRDGGICVWVLCDTDAPMTIRRFCVAGYGIEIKDHGRLHYIDAVCVPGAEVIFHLFEREEV